MRKTTGPRLRVLKVGKPMKRPKIDIEYTEPMPPEALVTITTATFKWQEDAVDSFILVHKAISGLAGQLWEKGYGDKYYLLVSEKMRMLFERTDLLSTEDEGYADADQDALFVGVFQDRWRMYQSPVVWNDIYIVPQKSKECIRLTITNLGANNVEV